MWFFNDFKVSNIKFIVKFWMFIFFNNFCYINRCFLVEMFNNVKFFKIWFFIIFFNEVWFKSDILEKGRIIV